jgi:hypothetical protein
MVVRLSSHGREVVLIGWHHMTCRLPITMAIIRQERMHTYCRNQ